MADDDIVLVSTTDTLEEVQAALGLTAAAPATPATDPADVQRDDEAETARLEREAVEAAESFAAPEPAEPPAPVFDTPQPQVDDRNADGSEKYTYEEWIAALAQWATAKGKAEALAETQRLLAERDQKAADRRARNALKDRLTKHQQDIEAFKRSHADFDAVYRAAETAVQEIVAKHGPNGLATIDGYTVHDAQNGAELVYYLLQHPDDLARIAAEPLPRKQVAALGRLEGQIGKGGTKTRATASTGSTDDNEDYQAFKRRREREIKAQRAR